MKLSPRDALAYFRKPDPARSGLLIYGADAMRVATRRQEVIAALIGPQGEVEMRLTRMLGADLRKDPAKLNDAVKAQGFFPGPRAAFVEDATDGLAPAIGAALSDWREGDAQIIVTAGQLTAKSALRKLFEGDRNALAVGIYDDPPSRDEISQMLGKAGLDRVGQDAFAMLTELSRSLDPGDFRQTVEKLGLYMHSTETEVTDSDVALCAPQSSEADVDALLAIVADGQTDQIAPVLRRLYAQGVTPVTLCIGATRHFRGLHTAASDPAGAGSGIARLRPPVFGPKLDMMTRQASQWGRDRLERGLTVLLDTDLQLRSTSRAPLHALVERALIRLAMMARR